MAVEKNIQKVVKEQELTLKNREDLSISGVEVCDRFSDNEIVLYTNMGKLSIKGENLHINKLNVETGDFSASGRVVSLIYSKAGAKNLTFFQRVFK